MRVWDDGWGALLLAWDAAVSCLVYWFAYRVRFNGGIPDRYTDLLVATVPVLLAGSLITLVMLGAYRKASWTQGVTARNLAAFAGSAALAMMLVVSYVAITHPVNVASVGGPHSLGIPVSAAAVQPVFAVVLFAVGRVLLVNWTRSGSPHPASLDAR